MKLSGTPLHPRTVLALQLHFVITLIILIWSFVSRVPTIVTVEILLILLPLILLVMTIVECGFKGNCEKLSSLMTLFYLFTAILFILIQSERKHTLVLPMPSA